MFGAGRTGTTSPITRRATLIGTVAVTVTVTVTVTVRDPTYVSGESSGHPPVGGWSPKGGAQGRPPVGGLRILLNGVGRLP